MVSWKNNKLWTHLDPWKIVLPSPWLHLNKEQLQFQNFLRDQYLKTVRPMHEKYVEPTRKYADIIINGGMNKMALELIRTKIESVLQEEV